VASRARSGEDPPLSTEWVERPNASAPGRSSVATLPRALGGSPDRRRGGSLRGAEAPAGRDRALVPGVMMVFFSGACGLQGVV
jgi:hypothetical protein